jgi:hypothetical protein
VSVVYDAGVFIAAERSNRELWADHRARLELGVIPTTTAPVVAQVSRSVRQVQMRRFLRGCEIEAFEQGQAHEVGALLARARTSDVVDAHLIIVAAKTAATVLTGDIDDLTVLSSHLSARVAVRLVAE